MNFLAHAHLSGNDDKLLAGNMMADAVKGKKWTAFAPEIGAGILLHRYIDSFTDKHPLVRESKALIRNDFGLYSGVVVDLYFDHFLAAGWENHSALPLPDFSRHVYAVMTRYFTLLPARVKYILPFMIAQNWLNGYASPYELERIFYNMDRRTRFRSGMKNAVNTLEKHYNKLQENFLMFYPQLETGTKEFIARSIKQREDKTRHC